MCTKVDIDVFINWSTSLIFTIDMQRTQIMQSVPYHFECRKLYTISNKAKILSSKHNTMIYILSSLDILVLFIFSNPVEI